MSHHEQAAMLLSARLSRLIAEAEAYKAALDKSRTICLLNPAYEYDFLKAAAACVDDGEFNRAIADLEHDFAWLGNNQMEGDEADRLALADMAAIRSIAA